MYTITATELKSAYSYNLYFLIDNIADRRSYRYRPFLQYEAYENCLSKKFYDFRRIRS